MNFHELLAKARENQQTKKTQIQPVKRFSTAIPPPKKDVKPKGISPNVRAFLEKKEQEEKKKIAEQKKAREKYLDKSKQCYRKEQNIHELLKEANEKGLQEPEHVLPNSKSAQAANSSFMAAKSNSSSKHKSHSSQSSNTKPEHSKPDQTKQETYKPNTGKVKVKVKPSKAPPPSFADLMKMAAQKESKSASPPCQSSGNSRPMTQKEKEDYEKQLAFKKTKEYRILTEYGPAALERYRQQQREKEEKANPPTAAAVASTTGTSSGKARAQPTAKPVSTVKSPSGTSGHGVASAGVKRRSDGTPVTNGGKSTANAARDAPCRAGQGQPTRTNAGRAEPSPPIVPSKKKAQPKYDVENEHVLVCRPASNGDQNLSAWDRIYSQVHRKRPNAHPARGGDLDSDEEDADDVDEYDEEMDDFIDDGPMEDPYANDVSSQIRAIFGYDRRKFRYEADHEINNMETSYRQQMMEEARSARLGMKEDMEDIRREEEELKRKAIMKKKMKMKR